MAAWVQLICGMALILSGLFFIVTSVIGNFRFGFVLSRMQAAALGDTMGLLLGMLGLAVLTGFSFAGFKMLASVAFQWVSSPVASHMLVRMELESAGKGDKS